MSDAPSVLLLSLPWGALERPALGLSLLQRAARDRGFECETRYLGFELADRIGAATYQWVTHTVPYETFCGEWLFADALHGPDEERAGDYVDRILRSHWHLDESDIMALDRLRAPCTEFIDGLVHLIDWARYDVVGFTCTFQQNLASLALGRRLAAAHPDLTLVFGGANWEAEMGVALHEAFPFVDAVCQGDGDHTFPAFLEAMRDGISLDGVGGLVVRGPAGETLVGPPAAPIDDMDALPVPDFEPYFRDLVTSSATEDVAPMLLIETSRGCWWGAHSHCSFCGLNGDSLGFRSKRADRVLQELRELTDQWAIGDITVVDNILDMRYFKTLLPELAAAEDEWHFFWEVKSNLSRAQVELLARAGIDHVQPGVESLSDRLLVEMNKGTTRLRNTALLKWCREYGVTPEWNLLFGFPGETADDYDDLQRLAVVLSHLQPPSGQGQIRLDRFSPYERDPDAYGMTNVRPAAPLAHLYRCDPDLLSRISYYFDFDYEDGQDPGRFAPIVTDAIATWNKLHSQSEFWVLPGAGPDGDELVLLDDRGRRRRTARLSGWKAAVYEACDRPRSREYLDQLDAVATVDHREVDRFLDRCAATGAMLAQGDTHLALGVHRPARRSPTPTSITPIPITVEA